MIAKTSAPTKPTPAELNLLRILWALGPATVKQAHQAMQAERPDITYAIVLRQMQIMHSKGLLTRDVYRLNSVNIARIKMSTRVFRV